MGTYHPDVPETLLADVSHEQSEDISGVCAVFLASKIEYISLTISPKHSLLTIPQTFPPSSLRSCQLSVRARGLLVFCGFFVHLLHLLFRRCAVDYAIASIVVSF